MQKGKIQLIFYRSVLVLAAYFVCFIIIASGLYYSFNHFDKTDDFYRVKLYTEGKNVSYTPICSIYINGRAYISVSKLSEYCEFVIAGDSNKLILLTAERNQRAEFIKDSTSFYINGTSANLLYPVVFTASDRYLPLEFLSKYLTGYSVVKDEKSQCFIVKKSNRGVSYKQESLTSTPKCELSTDISE